MPFDETANYLTQLPNEYTGYFASAMPEADFHAFRLASRHAATHSVSEFAARYFPILDVKILGVHLRSTNNMLDNRRYAGSVRTITFTDRAGQMGNMQSQLTLVAQILSKVPRLHSVRIQTHRPQNCQVVLRCLTTAILPGALAPPILRLSRLNLTPDERNPRPPRYSTQDLLTLLTTYSLTLKTLSLDSAILPTAVAWEPVLVYIRDTLNLDFLRFAHYDYSPVAPNPLFVLDEESPVLVNCGVMDEEEVWIEESEAEMRGSEAVKRGANRMLMILGLGSFDPQMIP